MTIPDTDDRTYRTGGNGSLLSLGDWRGIKALMTKHYQPLEFIHDTTVNGHFGVAYKSIRSKLRGILPGKIKKES